MVAVSLILWNLIQTVSPSEFRKREGTFALHPRHVWTGIVRSTEIGEGDLTICAEDDSWSLQAANGICKDLGFEEGVMLFGRRDIELSAMESVDCIFYEESGAYCRRRRTPCSKAAWVSCQFPGYIGCYSFDPNGLPFEQYQRSAGYSDEMAIEICTSRCSKNYFAYAGLEDGSRCYCGNNAPMGIHQADRSSCMKPCNDDAKQSCGGIGHIAVYESKLGKCNGTYSVHGGNWYIASPGFPGNYNPSTSCFWMFITPTFTDTTVNIIGMDLTHDETLRIMSYANGDSKATSDQTWSTNREADVNRGTWRLNLKANSISAGIAFIFTSNPGSQGNRQFLMQFKVNNGR
ncbi:hypothetical protein BSL78_18103 [Apostichopus japonicus]|uniref:Uncharacterized protein n=1 Tax=Stichopus japonicus TaxID=307972 RepID=A0A2G8KAM7_STIJA|nr:hypothetical protein BSL78_18103 [Apostichopus japonicus]